jgi:hypothetical protein
MDRLDEAREWAEHACRGRDGWACKCDEDGEGHLDWLIAEVERLREAEMALLRQLSRTAHALGEREAEVERLRRALEGKV